MISKIAMAMVMVILAVIFYVLYVDAAVPLNGVFSVIRNGVTKAFKTLKGEGGGTIVDGPEICYIVNKKKYTCRINKMKYMIGSNGFANLTLADPKISKRHCMIKKRIKNGNIEFVLYNLSSKNPVEFYDETIRDYIYLEYRSELILKGKMTFYMGDTPVQIRIPDTSHKEVVFTEHIYKGTPAKEDSAGQSLRPKNPGSQFDPGRGYDI